jgi:hypothetical protein
MKTRNIKSFLLTGLMCYGIAVGYISCAEDDGNYDYLPDSEVSKIEL